MSNTSGITFSWKEVECERRNGLFQGYEIKLYYDDEVCTRGLVEFVTTFTIPSQSEPEFRFPKAISVAAINEVGVGDHCPPVNINLSGQNEIEFARTKCKGTKIVVVAN